MPSEPSRTSDDADVPVEADGDASGFDEETLYRTVRQAVQDAILDAVGTMLLVVVGTALALVGGSALVRTATAGDLSIPVLAVGVWLVAIGFYVVGSTLGVVQPVRDWF